MLFRTGTSTCRQGFYLRGLARGDSSNVGSIDWGICCKSSHHPYRWRDCYDEDVQATRLTKLASASAEKARLSLVSINKPQAANCQALKSLNVVKWRRVSSEVIPV